MVKISNLSTNRGNILNNEFEKEYFKQIENTINNELNIWTIVFPSLDNIFNAFKLTDFENLKVVILWQDPYHWKWQAHWLSFSVEDNIKLPPSLKNIYKELKSDLNIDFPLSWNLEKWARKWVLLLNSILTVRSGEPASHSKIWWEIFTDNIISEISNKKEKIVFILWWNFARSKKKLIDENKHFIIESAHPSPFSARNWFFGSKPFSKCNDYLKSIWKDPIDWNLD